MLAGSVYIYISLEQSTFTFNSSSAFVHASQHPWFKSDFRAKGQRVQAQTNGEPVGNFEWKQVLSHSIPEGPTYSPWFCKILNNYKPRGVPKPPSSGGEKGSGALEALPPLAGSSMQSPPGPGRSVIVHLLWEKRAGTLGFSGS